MTESALHWFTRSMHKVAVREVADPPWRMQHRPRIGCCRVSCQSWVRDRLSVPSPQLRADLQSAGLDFLEDITAPAVTQILEHSVAVLTRVPDLHDQISDVVRFLYILNAEPGYDVSHSEPRWRTAIFASLPDQEGLIGALRLAESIIHEAMHLTLKSVGSRSIGERAAR
jgi:hypothetical protein